MSQADDRCPQINAHCVLQLKSLYDRGSAATPYELCSSSLEGTIGQWTRLTAISFLRTFATIKMPCSRDRYKRNG
jgi:hypothetical protein